MSRDMSYINAHRRTYEVLGKIYFTISIIVTAWINIIFGNVEVVPFTLFTIIHVSFSWFIGSWYDKYRYLSYHDPLTGVYNRSMPIFILRRDLKEQSVEMKV